MNPADNYDMLTTLFKGYITGAILAALQGSSEQHIGIYKKPEIKLVATKAFDVG